jgi:hypothetical protein
MGLPKFYMTPTLGKLTTSKQKNPFNYRLLVSLGVGKRQNNFSLTWSNVVHNRVNLARCSTAPCAGALRRRQQSLQLTDEAVTPTKWLLNLRVRAGCPETGESL